MRVEDHLEALLADRPLRMFDREVEPGQVRGLLQEAHGYTAAGEFITLRFLAALEAADEADTIVITGKPSLKMVMQGTNGDLATVAIVVNAIPRVLAAPPGLVTMRDLPPVHAW